MLAVPTLTDGRVTLRAHRDSDIDRVVEQSLDPDSVTWTSVPLGYTRDDAARFVREIMPGGWAIDQEWGFAVEYDGQYAATVSLRNEGPGRAELAYGSHPSVRGTGVMEAALRLLVEWGFAERDLKTILWMAHVGNWASRRLAWKVGFRVEGTLHSWVQHRGDLVDGWVGTLRHDDPREPNTSWLSVPRLTGDGVVLRIHRDQDAPRVQQACDDERTSYWLGNLPAPYTAADAERFLRLRSEGMAAGTDVHWVIADPGDDLLLGVVSLMRIQDGQTEVGYWAHPTARGRGVMTEAVRLATSYALSAEGLGLDRVTAYVAVDNAASRHVVEVAGFKETGLEHRATTCRDGKHDLVGYELLA